MQVFSRVARPPIGLIRGALDEAHLDPARARAITWHVTWPAPRLCHWLSTTPDVEIELLGRAQRPGWRWTLLYADRRRRGVDGAQQTVSLLRLRHVMRCGEYRIVAGMRYYWIIRSDGSVYGRRFRSIDAAKRVIQGQTA